MGASAVFDLAVVMRESASFSAENAFFSPTTAVWLSDVYAENVNNFRDYPFHECSTVYE